jgi:hypothetical protein
MSPCGPTMSSILDQSWAVCAHNTCYNRQSLYQKNVFKYLNTIFVQLYSNTELMLLPIMSGLELSVCPHDARQSKANKPILLVVMPRANLQVINPKHFLLKLLLLLKQGGPRTRVSWNFS